MSWLSIRCHACGRTFDIPAQIVGQKVLCPGCPTVFIAETPHRPLQVAGSERLPDDEPRIRRRKRMTRRRARALLVGPAIGFVVLGGAAMILTLLGLIVAVMAMSSAANPYRALGGLFYLLFGLSVLVGAAVSFGWGYMLVTAGYEIRHLGQYRHSVIGALSACFPWDLLHIILFRLVRDEWPPALSYVPILAFMAVGLPFGLWALALLLRADVRRLFGTPECEI
ncbi:MAG TPA: hypothetical protein VFA18_09010 [Gemmataceae bacterium]|nr:hypothetical protein [Gemmataceae bacterium]